MTFKALRTVRNDAGLRSTHWVELNVDDLAAGDVVIRSHYAAVNYKDARAVSGVGNVIKRFPCIPGIEVSGEVVSSRDARFSPGMLVTVQGGRDFGISHDGAYSEYVRVPGDWVHPIAAGFDPFTVVALGIGAYTAAVAIEALERHGVRPNDGEILVTGATGGCSSFAISMLSGLGYRVVGMSGKPEAHDYLHRIGASRVVGRDIQASHGRALDEQMWAACIDAVGGAPLDFALRTTRQRGIVAAFGNAAGETFSSSIYPFILRSITLAGINANHPLGARTSAWMRMTSDLKPQALEAIVHRIRFNELPAHCAALIGSGVTGRGVVCFDQ